VVAKQDITSQWGVACYAVGRLALRTSALDVCPRTATTKQGARCSSPPSLQCGSSTRSVAEWQQHESVTDYAPPPLPPPLQIPLRVAARAALASLCCVVASELKRLSKDVWRHLSLVLHFSLQFKGREEQRSTWRASSSAARNPAAPLLCGGRPSPGVVATPPRSCQAMCACRGKGKPGAQKGSCPVTGGGCGGGKGGFVFPFIHSSPTADEGRQQRGREGKKQLQQQQQLDVHTRSAHISLARRLS
jgi:hypothetical protein